ncbi:glycoside hydrolase family 9 protein [Ruminococcus flavefaciens]|uniref:glycoside hydrolase family 9 protein n=1 Tax=Ruminococcus flavefaciens TaxID=1265 RepID=UPI00048B0135|nr:glycoside hydrolase family 9 protein [Ruminococcus flavefaciens]
MHKKTKKVLAGVMAMATIAPAVVSTIAPLTASAGLVVGESSFTHKALPWHTCESSPAKQNFNLEDGTFHVVVEEPVGADKEKWDLQVRHRNLNFKAGHEYKVSMKVKGSRAGMELCSKIGNIAGTEEYFELDGGSKDMHMGPDMGGQWPQAAVKLTTDWQTFEGTFKPTKDLEACEWCFHYAKGTQYQGNAQKGDEIWFDDLSIDCVTCGDKEPGEGCCNADPNEGYGATNRDYSANTDANLKKGGKTVNFISVNQVGYFTNYAKMATLGDNKGDVLYGATTINLSGSYTWELVDAKSGTVVETGETTTAKADKDSADTVCKIDFSKAKTPGRYYLRIKGEDWRSMEFNIGDDIYTDKSHDMLKNALNYFYQNRSGLDIEEKYITSGDKSTLAHEGGHKTDTAYVQTEWHNEYLSNSEATSTYASSKITANKGWYDAGDHGKYVVNGGISVWTLLNMYERATYNSNTKDKFADGSGTVNIPESGDSKKIPDIIDECLYELEFMTAMKVDASEPTWGKKCAGMVYHKLHDHKWTGLATRPWDYSGKTLSDGSKGWETERIVKPPTLAATLNYSACSAQMARLIKPYDASKAEFYLQEAKDAYEAADKNWYEATSTEESNKTSLYAPFNQAKGGGPYGDNEVRDDMYWAACEIFTSCKALDDADADTYLTKLSKYENAFKIPERITGGENQTGTFSVLNWGNTASAGSISLLLNNKYLTDEQKDTLITSLKKTADAYIEEEETQGYGIPYKYDGPGYTDENNLSKDIIIKGYEWGSNSMVINNLMAMSYAYDVTGDAKYMNGVLTGMNYLLGCNPLSFSYVTGYGTYKEKNPHHRYWSYELDKTLPMAPDGVLSGGPNAGLQDPYVRALGFVPGAEDNPSQRCFVDSIEAWSTNEVTINWNAPLAWIVEFLQDKDEEYSYLKDKPPVSTTTTATTTKPVVTTTTVSGVTPSVTVWGDANCDGDVDMSDIVLIMQSLANPNKYGEGGTDKSAITAQGKANADVDTSSKGITTQDAVRIQNYLLNKISSLDPTK